MRIRCPSCHSPLEVLDDDPLTELACPSCGSCFSLVSQEETVSWEGSSRRTIGQFELIEQVGVGHFGRVWKAHDTKLDRVVAIKLPRREHLDATNIEQILREARAAAQLCHPNIVPIHEVGQAEDYVYLVSEFIDGCSLKECLSAQRLTARESAQLVRKIALALHHAHKAGVVHRDLKPANIMLDLSGEPHLMDFGLARRESGEVTVTQDGRILGTPAYMSPEQAKGDAHRADGRCDVYSAGVVLFELLTGELPFRGDMRMLVVQILQDEPPSPRRLNALVSRDMETICLKCLQKHPDRRYQSAIALADDLQNWMDGKPILARPVSRIESAIRWIRREPRTASLAAALVLALITGFISVTIQWRAAIAANETAEKNLDEKEKQRQGRQLNFERALSAVDKMLTHVGTQRLSSIPELAPVRKAILEDALSLYQELLDEKRDDTDLQAETAMARMRVASIQWLLQDRESALTDFEQSIEQFRRLLEGDVHNTQIALNLATCYASKAEIYSELGKYAEAVEAFQRAFDLKWELYSRRKTNVRGLVFGAHPFFEALLAANQPQRAVAMLERVVNATEPSLNENLETLGIATSFNYAALATSLDASQADIAKREQAWRRCVELSETVFSPDNLFIWSQNPLKHVPDLQHRTSVANILRPRYIRLASVLRLSAKFDEAIIYEAKAAHLHAQAVQSGEIKLAHNAADETALNALAINSLVQARELQDQGDNKQAIEYFQKALTAYSDLAKNSPTRLPYHIEAVTSALELAGALAKERQSLTEALALSQRNIDRALSLAVNDTESQLQLARAVQTGARRIRQFMGLAAAESTIRTAVAVSEQLPPAVHGTTAGRELLSWGHHNLGDVLQFVHKNPVEAAKHYERARILLEQLIAEEGLSKYRVIDLGWACQNGGAALFNTRQDAHVASVAVRGLEMRQYEADNFAEDPANTTLPEMYSFVSRVLARCPDPKPVDLQTTTRLAEEWTTSHATYGPAWRALGIARYRQGQFAGSISALQHAASANLQEPVYEYCFLAMAFARLEEKLKAGEYLKQGLAWIKKNGPNNVELRELQRETETVVNSHIKSDFTAN